jgi:hypothetical protein
MNISPPPPLFPYVGCQVASSIKAFKRERDSTAAGPEAKRAKRK